jgi:hypothetical protein
LPDDPNFFLAEGAEKRYTDRDIAACAGLPPLKGRKQFAESVTASRLIT